MVGVLTLPPISSVKSRAGHGGSVKHCMEVLDPCVYLLVVCREQGCELIDVDRGGQGVVCKHVVNMLTLPQDPANFLMEHSRPIPESFSASQSVPAKLGVVSPRADTILSLIFRSS
jgi:hypothetical protein